MFECVRILTSKTLRSKELQDLQLQRTEIEQLDLQIDLVSVKLWLIESNIVHVYVLLYYVSTMLKKRLEQEDINTATYVQDRQVILGDPPVRG